MSWGRLRTQRDLLLGAGCQEGCVGIRPQGQREALCWSRAMLLLLLWVGTRVGMLW